MRVALGLEVGHDGAVLGRRHQHALLPGELAPRVDWCVKFLTAPSKGPKSKDVLIEQLPPAPVTEAAKARLAQFDVVIITPDDITQFVPVATAKDSDLYVTQFDNSVVEDAGLLKMDFLGLKTLTLIKDTVKIIEAMTGEKLDMDKNTNSNAHLKAPLKKPSNK